MNMPDDVFAMLIACCAQAANSGDDVYVKYATTVVEWLNMHQFAWKPVEDPVILLRDGTLIEIQGSELTIWHDVDPPMEISIDKYALCQRVARGE